MSGKYVIAISREFGSGGHEIGRKLADKLGIKFYNKELIAQISKNSGMAEHLVEYYDEMPTKSLIFSLAMDAYPMSFAEVPINQKVYRAQVDTVKKLAEKESCVIIGRCADSILSDCENLISVFIHSDLDTKIERVMKSEKLSREQAKDLIVKTDKKRSSFYNFYAVDKKWGESTSYDITLDSSALGIDSTVELLYQYLKLKGFTK